MLKLFKAQSTNEDKGKTTLPSHRLCVTENWYWCLLYFPQLVGHNLHESIKHQWQWHKKCGGLTAYYRRITPARVDVCRTHSIYGCIWESNPWLTQVLTSKKQSNKGRQKDQWVDSWLIYCFSSKTTKILTAHTHTGKWPFTKTLQLTYNM